MAPVTAANHSLFHQFPRLPAELRIQIWRNALPDKDGPALYFYEKGCWYARFVSERQLTLEFYGYFLDYVEVEVPMVFVNHEARAIALTWFREQQIKMWFREERKGHHIFMRPFDVIDDFLYVSSDKFKDFCCERWDRLSQLELNYSPVGTERSLRRIAVSAEALLQGDFEAVPMVLFRHSDLIALFVVVNWQVLDLQIDDSDMKVQRRWELDTALGMAFVWNHDHRRFDWENGDCIAEEALYKRIEEVGAGVIGQWLIRQHMRRFEIRPAFAVRRPSKLSGVC